MKNQFLYLISEGFRGFKSSKDGVLTSIFTIGICTSVLGVLLMLMVTFFTRMNAHRVDNSLRVFIAQDFESEESLNEIQSHLRKISFVDSMVFISKDMALKEFKNEIDPDMLEVLDDNPLPPSWILYPGEYYQSSSRSQVLRDQLLEIKGVEEVSHISPLLLWLDKWKLPLYVVGLFSLIFVGIALSMIISNSVKLNLYSRKDLVDNMKYCGAAESFIVIPFLFEGLLLGTIGSFIGIAFCLLFYFITDLFVPGILSVGLTEFILFVFVTTSILTSLASFKTVRKFIHVI